MIADFFNNVLQGPVTPRIDESFWTDDLHHPTEAGIQACAQQTARIIQETATPLGRSPCCIRISLFRTHGVCIFTYASTFL